MSVTSNEIIGTPARLGVARLGATRLGAIPRSSQVKAPGVYAWTHEDSGVKHGDPPISVDNAEGGFASIRRPRFYWTLGDAAGAQKIDFFGGPSLVEQTAGAGLVQSVVGKIGLATRFTDETAYLQPAGDAELDMPSGDFTISLWFYPTGSATDQYIFSYGTNTVLGTVTLHIFPGTFAGIRFFTDIATPATTANAPTDNQWNYVLAWHDSSLGTNYVQLNGGAVVSAVGPDAAGSLYTRLARHAGAGAQFYGSLDAVGVWPFLLTDSEKAILAVGVEPVALWTVGRS